MEVRSVPEEYEQCFKRPEIKEKIKVNHRHSKYIRCASIQIIEAIDNRWQGEAQTFAKDNPISFSVSLRNLGTALRK